MALNLKYQTVSEFLVRFRQKFRDSSGIEAAKMAHWLIERINAADLTDAQVRSAFGLSGAQYVAAKARLTTLHDRYAAVMTARGE